MTRCIGLYLVVTALAWAGPAAAKVKVMATTSKLAALARTVGGARAKVEALALATQDPHWVDARPHLALKLARADLLLAVGLELEVGWLPTLQKSARNRHLLPNGRGYLDCSTLIRPLEVPRGPVDRSMGDVHPGGSPHYLWDPRQAAKVAQGIASRLAALDPAGAKAYRANARRFQQRVKAGLKRWKNQLRPLRGAKVIAYHKSFAYLANWVGFTVVGHLEPRPGIPPNPRHVARVLSAARRQRAALVIQEGFYPSRTAQVVAKRASARLVRLPGGPAKGKSYLDFVNNIVKLIAGKP